MKFEGLNLRVLTYNNKLFIIHQTAGSGLSYFSMCGFDGLKYKTVVYKNGNFILG